MAIVQGYPNPATSPPPVDKQGVLIPADGIPVLAEDPYYAPMFLSGVLLRRQPLSGAAIDVVPGRGVTRSMVDILTSQLATTPGLLDGELVQTAGYAVANDGGHDWYRFVLGASSGANAFDKINTSNGQWQKVRTGMVATARSTTIRGDGSTDDTAAWENVLARMATQGAARDSEPGLPNTGPTIYCEPSMRSRVTAPIRIDPAIHCADISIIGANSRATNDYGSMIFWDSPNTTDPMIIWGCRGGFVGGLFLSPGSGRTLRCAIDWRADTSSPYGPGTAIRVHKCNIRPFSGGSFLLYGIVTDLDDLAAPQNMEEASFSDLYISGLETGIWLKGGQPYNTTIHKVLFESHITALPTGRGLRIDAGSSSVAMSSCNFGRLAVGIALGNHGPVTLRGFDSERTKALIRQPDGSLVSNSPNAGSPISIIGGRVSANSYGLAAERPTIAAEDDTWIHVPFGLDLLSLTAVKFISTAEAKDRWQILLGPGASGSGHDCTLPNMRPVRFVDPTSSSRFAWSSSKGRKAAGLPGLQYGDLHSPGGTRSRDVISVVIPGPFTTLRVPWDHPEFGRPMVIGKSSIETGSPSAGSLQDPTCVADSTGCDVTLGASPGATAADSVRVDLMIRDASSIDSQIGETGFTSGSTVRATAVSAGLRNFKWLAVLVHMNAVPTGNQAITNCVNGANGWQLYGNGNGTTGSAFCSRYSGAGNTNSPTIALSAADVGRTHLYVFTQDSTTLRSYKARAQVGSGNAHTPAAAAAGTRHLFGVNNAGTEPIADWTLLGVAGSDTGTVPGLADVHAYFDAVAASHKLVLFPGSITTEHLWWLTGDATIVDQGSVPNNVTLVSGTAPALDLVVPRFPWIT